MGNLPSSTKDLQLQVLHTLLDTRGLTLNKREAQKFWGFVIDTSPWISADDVFDSTI